MKKPDSLRTALIEALPELATSPEALVVHVERGELQARWSEQLRGFAYSYNLVLTLLAFPGEPDEVMLPLLLWLRTHQPDLLQAEKGIAFDVDLVDAGAVDLEITLPLTEAVDAVQASDGSWQLTTRDEPPVIGLEALIEAIPYPDAAPLEDIDLVPHPVPSWPS